MTEPPLSPRDPEAWVAAHTQLVVRLEARISRLFAASKCLATPYDDDEISSIDRAIGKEQRRRSRAIADIAQVREQIPSGEPMQTQTPPPLPRWIKDNMRGPDSWGLDAEDNRKGRP